MGNTGAIRAGKAFVELYGDDSKLVRILRSSEGKLKAWGANVQAMGLKLLAVGGALAAPLALAVGKASAMEETMNKFNVVFGESATAVKAWGDEFAGSIGRSKEQIASFMAGSQDLFVPLGFAADAATDMSKQVTQLAIDLASFNNMADADVLRDLHAALTGSGEVMKKYGVIVSEAAVKQELLNQGMDPKGATDQQKVFARWSIILRGTTAAQGDAERSSGSFANQMKALRATIDDAAVEIGSTLLPAVTEIVTELVDIIRGTAEWAAENQGLIVTLAKVTVGTMAAGAGLVILGTAAKAVATVTAAVRGLTLAVTFLMAHPLLLTFTAATAAVIALGLALSNTSKDTGELIDQSNALLAALQERRAEMSNQFQRLQELADKERLNNREMAEAQRLITLLEKSYGALGIKVDAATGKITGLSDAWKAANEAAARLKINKLSEDIGSLETKLTELEGKPGAGWSEKAIRADIERIAREKEALRLQIQFQKAEREALIKDLAAGDVTPSARPGAGGAGKAKDDAEKRLKESLRYSAQLFHRQQQIRLGMIEDAHAREIERIDEKYNHEINMAKLAGKVTAGIEETRQLELRAARKRHAKEDAEEQKRQAKEAMEEFVAGKKLKPAWEAAAMLASDVALEAAGPAMGVAGAGLAGAIAANAATAAAQFAMMGRDILGEGKERFTVRGTFSGAVAGRLAAGGGPAERTARATEQTASDIKVIRRKVEFTGPTTSKFI